MIRAADDVELQDEIIKLDYTMLFWNEIKSE